MPGLISIPKRFHTAVAIALVLTAACAIRVWHFDFDPLTYRMPLTHDSFAKFIMADRVSTGDMEPMNYWQPYFTIYATGFLLRLGRAIGLTQEVQLWKLASLFMIGISVLTVWLVYPLARLLRLRKGAAIVAMAALAVVPVNVIGSRYLKEDIPLMFWLTLAMIMLVRMIIKGRWYDYLGAGLVIGFSLGTKLTASTILPFYVIAHALRAWQPGNATRCKRFFASPWFYAGIPLIAIGFLLFNPYCIIRWHDFWMATKHQLAYSGHGHNDVTAIAGRDFLWSFYLRFAILPGISLPLTLMAIAGLIYAFARGSLATRFVALWVLCFYLEVESSPAKPFPFFARYIHALFPLLCIFAADALSRLYAGLPGKWGKYVTVVAGSLCLGMPLAHTAMINDHLHRDTRVRASEWIDTHLPAGASIHLDDAYYSPRPRADLFDAHYHSRLYHDTLEKLTTHHPTYIVLNSFRTDRYEVAAKTYPPAAKINDFYHRVRNAGILEAEFRPRHACETYAFHNPIIWIYRMPE